MAVSVLLSVDLDKVRQLKVNCLFELSRSDKSPRRVETLAELVTLLDRIQQAALAQGVSERQVFGSDEEVVE